MHLGSYSLLSLSVGWFVNGVSGQRMSPIFKNHDAHKKTGPTSCPKTSLNKTKIRGATMQNSELFALVSTLNLHLRLAVSQAFK
jgi:hypothetical protein